MRRRMILTLPIGEVSVAYTTFRIASVKTIAAALLTFALGIASAQAQTIDLATLKCKDFIDSGRQTISFIVMWLDGYYTDEEDAAVFEPDKLKIKAEKLSAFCAQNPKIGLMTAAESVMAK